MNAEQLTHANAIQIIKNILSVLEDDDEWSSDTTDAIVDQLQCSQGKLWTTDEYGMFQTDKASEQKKEVCPNCGSDRIQHQMWVRANTGEVLDATERYSWCEQCDEEGRDAELTYTAVQVEV